MKNCLPYISDEQPAVGLGDEDWDDEDYKDVYPEPEPGQSSEEFLIRHHLACDGYRVNSFEEVKTHPVIILRLTRSSPIDSVNNFDHGKYFRSVLARAGFRLGRDELSVSVTGKKVLVAFQTGKPGADPEAILNEPNGL